MSASLAAALKYAERGIPVLPVDVNKRPIGLLAPHGSTDASTNARALRNWWTLKPDALVAVATGKRSGLVVIDVDPRHGGADGIEDATSRLGQLPPTVRVTTPSGGWHYWLRHPEGEEVRNSAGTLAPGVDVRGAGGFVVAPPSRCPKGAWRWSSGTGLAEMPDEWADAMRAKDTPNGRKPEPPGTWVSMVRNGAPEGGRNHALARLVGHMLAKDLDARLTLELAHLVNSRNKPPLPGDEVDRIVASIAGKEVRRRQNGGAR